MMTKQQFTLMAHRVEYKEIMQMYRQYFKFASQEIRGTEWYRVGKIVQKIMMIQ